MFRMLISQLRRINFFASPTTARNEYELQNERIATRAFVLLLALSCLVLFVYTAQVSVTQTIEIQQPSYEQFLLLSLRYPETLRCPCDNVASVQKDFITLEPRFHQLCSSYFISQNWLNHINSAVPVLLSDDFSYTGGLFFQTIASFCQLANDTISNALQTFNLASFITAQALFRNVFDAQVEVAIESFQSSIKHNYYQSFDLIQFSAQTNSLVSSSLSNVEFRVDFATQAIGSRGRSYANNTCNCDLTSFCVAPSVVRFHAADLNGSSSFFIIPGLFTGCFLVEAIRQSSLECFYSTSCITMIEQFLNAPLSLANPILPMDSSVDSQFNITSTLDQLLFQAMTEKWRQYVSHAQYFSQCHVSTCTYSFISKFNIVYIITTLIGLVGGLIKILHLLLPLVVKFIRRRISSRPVILELSGE